MRISEFWHDENIFGEWFVYLSVIGDSTQGFLNCVIFVFLTRSVRTKYVQLLCCETAAPPLVGSEDSSLSSPLMKQSRTVTNTACAYSDDDKAMAAPVASPSI